MSQAPTGRSLVHPIHDIVESLLTTNEAMEGNWTGFMEDQINILHKWDQLMGAIEKQKNLKSLHPHLAESIYNVHLFYQYTVYFRSIFVGEFSSTKQALQGLLTLFTTKEISKIALNQIETHFTIANKETKTFFHTVEESLDIYDPLPSEHERMIKENILQEKEVQETFEEASRKKKEEKSVLLPAKESSTPIERSKSEENTNIGKWVSYESPKNKKARKLEVPIFRTSKFPVPSAEELKCPSPLTSRIVRAESTPKQPIGSPAVPRRPTSNSFSPTTSRAKKVNSPSSENIKKKKIKKNKKPTDSPKDAGGCGEASKGKEEFHLFPEHILPTLRTLEEGDDIAFEYNSVDPSVPVVRFATLEKAVARLTSPNLPPDNQFRNTFFMTYPSFSSSSLVLQAFFDRFSTHKDCEYKDRIILRTIGALKHWVDGYPDVFVAGSELRTKLESFVTINIAELYPTGSDVLLKRLHLSDTTPEKIMRRQRQNAPALCIDDYAVLQSDVICFNVLPPAEVARHWTSFSATLFLKLEHNEFMNKNWCGEEKNEASPTIMSIVKQFNLLSRWTMTEILRCVQLKQRATTLSNMIDILYYFNEINNFHGLLAVLSGLTSTPIRRLHKTWEEISDDKKNVLARIQNMMSIAANYKEYRRVLQAIPRDSSAIPFIGVFLSDLVFIEDGNKSFFPGKKINFVKYSLITSVLETLFAHKAIYDFVQVPAILTWISKSTEKVLTEEEGYALSTKIEPRVYTTEAFEALLLIEEKLLHKIDNLTIHNELLITRDDENTKKIEALSFQLREHRKVITLANAEDSTLLQRFSRRAQSTSVISLKQADKDILGISVSI